ncbi:hypothetical protein [Sphingomonas solaris]|uniref:Pentapeptide MXKDX repeat protein n=1 Tax=Alterirhizorhabdus solaris TaxID=2529389 RepID=A0A558R0L3_9SPHN|nr:hypothetical protein [Sphingomonas solaris]TVV72862.1 hypothetical protein FOY91_13315 [Sphingomonas solaris]
MKTFGLIGGVFAGAMMLAAVPAGAQMNHDAMKGDAKAHDMTGHDMKAGHGAMISEADKTKMAGCNAMSHADAAKDARCAELMKMHPDMMHHMPAKKTM